MFILNREEEIVAILSGNADDSGCHFFNSTLTLEINKGASLTFEVDTTEPDIVQHVKEENMVVVHDGENYRLLIIKEVSDIHESDYIKEVYCEDASAELIDEVIYDEVSGKVEMGIVLQSLLKGTRWGIGEVDNTYIRSVKPEFKLKTVLNGIQELAKQYDAEIDFTVEFAGNKITSRKVHMKKAFGRTLGKRFEFGKDTTLVKRTVNTADIKTAVVPFGATDEETGEVLTIESVKWEKPTNKYNKPLGQTYLEDEEATELWGYKGTGEKKRAKWIAITFEDCKDANELINYASLQLSRFNKPKVSYEANVIDLFRMSGDDSYSFEKVMIGDLVGIVDHEFVPALALESRVVKLELDLNDISNSKVTLGTVVESIIDKDLKTQIEELNLKVSAVASNVDLSDIEDRLDQVEGETGTGKWEQIEEINNLIFGNAVGYHFMSENNGIWVFDKPVNEKPTKAVALKGGCIGLAKYDEQLQEWKVGTFIDGNSVNASMINTGTLKADRIEANALTVNHFNQELKTIINSVGDKPSRTEVTTSIKTAVDEINLSVSTKYSTKSETESMKTTAITESKSYADTKKQEAITTASTDATNKVNSAKTELNKTIDNIQVGGRNLLRNSALEGITFPYTSAEYNWRTASVNPSDTVLRTRELIKDCPAFPQGVYGIKFVYSGTTDLNVDIAQDGRVMEHGETYTLSAYFKLTKGNPKFALQYGTTPYPAKSFNGSNEWVKCSFTFTYDKTQFSDKLSTNIYFGIRGNSFEGYACGFKLEKGNKSTDWTPAPEDVNSEINKKANSVDVYTKTETYTKAQTDSAIKVAKEEINLGVSSTYETKTNVETKINNIQIGGRNLLPKNSLSPNNGATGTFDSNTNTWTLTATKGSNNWGRGLSIGSKHNIIIPFGQSVVYSFEIKVPKQITWNFDVNNIPVSGSAWGNNDNDLTASRKTSTKTISKVNEWVKCWAYVENTSSLNTNKVDIKDATSYFGIVTTNETADITYYIRNVKVEFGNKATDWSPCPEDINSAIDSKANSVDVYKKSETYTKTETNSAINVAKDEINLGVKNTYETKTNVETKISSSKTEAINTSKSYADTKKTEAINSASADATNKVNSAKTELNTAINKKANSTDVYKKTETYTKSETDSKINVAKNDITLSVSNTYETKTNVETKVNNAVNGIQIGGRNLVINSHTLNNTYSSAGGFAGVRTIVDDAEALCKKQIQVKCTTATSTGGPYFAIYPKATNKIGKTYTWSFWAKCSSNKTLSSVGHECGGRTSINLTTSWQKFTLTWKFIDHSNSAFTFYGNYAVNDILYIRDLKIEEGTKATDWTPAPEDIDTAIDSKANAKDVYTKTETEAKINVSKNEITNTVSSTYLSKSDATNTYATKSSLTQTKDSITASFESSGGYNLVKNGCFLNDRTHWATWGTPSQLLVETSTSGYGKSIKIVTSNTNQGLQQVISDLKSGKKYTASALVYVTSGVCSLQVANNGSYPGKSSTKTGAWEWLQVTFTASSTSVTIQIGRNGGGSNGTYNFTAVMLQEGDIKSAYSPHPNEIYAGSTVIDASGVTIKNGALKVQNNAGQTVLSGDSSGNLVIGGNSASGKLLLKNASGTTIGEMNQNGLTLSDSAMVITSKYRIGESNEQKVTFDGANIKFSTTGGGTTSTVSIGADTGSTIGFNAKNGYHFYGGTARFDGGISQDGNVILNGTDTWLRTYGGTGWFNATYSGGWHMTDSTWIRAYNNKSVYTPKVMKADGGFQAGNNFSVSDTGAIIAKNGSLQLGGLGNSSWVGFYDTTGKRKCYVGKGSQSADSLYLSADSDKYILTIGHLCPSGHRMYWLGTNSPAQQWKGLCAEGGTVGASDIRSKENIERLDGTLVAYDEVSEELKEYQLANFKTNTRATSGDYYEFIKDRFKPSYYNYKLSEHVNEETGEYTISPEDEYNMLKNVGFIAQDYDLETDKVAQEFIFENEDGSLSYNHMSYVTVGMVALQEATQKIDALEKENQELRAELDKIKKHLGI